MALIRESQGNSVPFGTLFDDIVFTIRGTQGDDVLVGTLFDDIILGLGGNDLILADPTVFDFVGGDDVVDGGSGDDVIFTFGGDDEVDGGRGNDTIRTADGEDTIRAGSGNDDVQSGRGEDTVLGQAGDDELRGGEDNDDVRGGGGNDRVIGGSDDDTLRDGSGVDQLEGRTGDDTVILAADDTTDTVVFMADDVGNGVDTIRGFDTAAPNGGGDLIDLREVAGDGFELVEDLGDVLIFADPAGDEVGLTLLARVEDVDDAEALADNILDGAGAGTALVAEALDGAFDPLGTDGGGLVLALTDMLDDDGATGTDEAPSLAQALDDGAVPVGGTAAPAALTPAMVGEAGAGAVETSPSLDALLANVDAII